MHSGALCLVEAGKVRVAERAMSAKRRKPAAIVSAVLQPLRQRVEPALLALPALKCVRCRLRSQSSLR